MADVSKIKLGSTTYNIKDTSKLPLAGGTMTGQLFTSFKSAVAMGSYESTTSTIPNLLEELRYSSGCVGSVNITTAYTKDNITIPNGWYNFLYVPHRSGGINGVASGDNCNYGSLWLSGMTVSGCYMIRYSSSAIAEVKNLYADTDTVYTHPTTSGNKHIPSGGSSGQILRWSADGTATWGVDNNTIPTIYCNTAANTADKVGQLSGGVLVKGYYVCQIVNSNSAASAITLNVNNKGKKAIYINGAASSNTNYTLPAGMYIVYYNSNRFRFRTDAAIPALVSGGASIGINTTNIGTTAVSQGVLDLTNVLTAASLTDKI